MIKHAIALLALSLVVAQAGNWLDETHNQSQYVGSKQLVHSAGAVSWIALYSEFQIVLNNPGPGPYLKKMMCLHLESTVEIGSGAQNKPDQMGKSKQNNLGHNFADISVQVVDPVFFGSAPNPYYWWVESYQPNLNWYADIIDAAWTPANNRSEGPHSVVYWSYNWDVLAVVTPITFTNPTTPSYTWGHRTTLNYSNPMVNDYHTGIMSYTGAWWGQLWK
jgi:hypothetical protein